MFEAKPPKAHVTHDSPQAGELRPLTWGDLRMRLEAARDLRSTMHAEADEPHASFDSLSARRMADQANGKDLVNPDDLANGKGPSGITVADDDSGTGSDLRK